MYFKHKRMSTQIITASQARYVTQYKTLKARSWNVVQIATPTVNVSSTI